MIGFSTGLLQGVIFEALGWGEPIEDFINEQIDRIKEKGYEDLIDEPCP